MTGLLPGTAKLSEPGASIPAYGGGDEAKTAQERTLAFGAGDLDRGMLRAAVGNENGIDEPVSGEYFEHTRDRPLPHAG